jgi:hypothetical protein
LWCALGSRRRPRLPAGPCSADRLQKSAARGVKKIGRLERAGLISKQIDKNKLARKAAKKQAKEKRNGARFAMPSEPVLVSFLEAEMPNNGRAVSLV